ncbi:ABC transporter substrate-binding protein [Streptomyces sp. NPDC005438]|uniref:ABC transporter substrate-binding protein n=1 Tax=Streptomyces sp. NPDC005438 TaxID=3156880 RepID=UPI0033BF4ABB
MTRESRWAFRDDRDWEVTASRRPRRIVAYAQAAAVLEDLGLPVAGVFGSVHDEDGLDPVKAATLAPSGAPYLGAGSSLTAPVILAAEPDLLVSVTYDGKQLYGVGPEVAAEVEALVPTVALGVGAGHRLFSLRDRFVELARSLGAEPSGDTASDATHTALARSTEELRGTAAEAERVRVMALSPAGPDRAHVARPGAWPDLQELTEAGVRLLDMPGPGANWSTLPWEEVVEAAPDIVLADVRGNATPIGGLETVPAWQRLTARATVLPWNPELPCTSGAISDLFATVSAALRQKARELTP